MRTAGRCAETRAAQSQPAMCLRRPTRRRDDKRVSEDAQAPAAVLELGLLGPVQAVRAGGRLAVGGPKQRAVLALLVVETGLVVPADRLIEQLWRGGGPPPAGGAPPLFFLPVAAGAASRGGA